jgi:ferredoxin
MPEYNIKVQFEQKTFSFLCSDDQDIISAAKKNGIDLPSSCCSGVCTDCASMILEGSVDQEDAMGLNDDLREKGFALLCVAYPKSDLNIVIGKDVEDDLYNDQFGKYQK